MPVALPALDLVAWLTFGVVLVLAVTLKYWLTPLFGVIDSTIGHIPYVGGKIHGGEEAVLRSLDLVIAKSRDAMTTLLQGVKWSMNELITGVRDFGDAVADNWKLLVESAIPGALALLYASLHGSISSVDKRVGALAGTIVDNLAAARSYATSEAAHAISSAANYTDGAISDTRTWAAQRINSAVNGVENEIAAASGAITRYVDAVVGNLRQAEDAAVSAARAAAATALEDTRRALGAAVGDLATSVAAMQRALEDEIGGVKSEAAQALSAAAAELRNAIAGGVTDAEQTASAALAAAEQTIEADLSAAANTAAASLAATASALQATIGGLAQAEQAVAGELSAAEHAAAGELADIYGLGSDALRGLLDRTDLSTLAGFGAGVVLLRAFAEAVTAESGLDRAECRAKHKQVCGVDPGAWTGLLEGLAALGFAFSLAELAGVAEDMIGTLAPVLEQAA